MTVFNDIITRCPQCAVAFRATANVLKVANGTVRCGSCLRTFNAQEHDINKSQNLNDDADANINNAITTPKADNNSIEDDESWALDLLREEENEEQHQERNPKPYRELHKEPHKEQHKEQSYNASNDTFNAEPPSFSASNDDVNDYLSDNLTDDAANEPADDHADDTLFDDDALDHVPFGDTVFFEDNEPQAFNPNNFDTDDFDLHQHEDEAEPLTHTPLDDSPLENYIDSTPSNEDTFSEERFDDERFDKENVDEDRFDEASLDEESFNTDTFDTNTFDNDLLNDPILHDDDIDIIDELGLEIDHSDVSSEALLSNINSDPIELLESSRHTAPPSHRGAWGASAIIMALVFCAQIAWFRFDVLATEEPYRQYYAQACHYLKCSLPHREDIAQIRTTQLLVRSHPDESNALVVDAIMINNATFMQAFPALQLEFKNIHGSTIASRAFQPSEYLKGDLIGSTIMPTNQPIQLALSIVDPGESAINYDINIIAAEPQK